MASNDDAGAVGHFNPRMKLKEYKGEKGDAATSWLLKFDRVATALQWTDAQKCQMFDLHMDDAADSWYSSLSREIQGNWNQLKTAFGGNFVS